MTEQEQSAKHQAVGQREAEIEFRLLVENVQDVAIFLMDPAGQITSWNAAAERMKGWPAGEAIGQHFRILYTSEDAAARKPELHLEQARVTGKFEEEAWRRRKDGSLFWAHVTLTPLHNETGALRGFAKITHDRTRQKLLESDLERGYQERHELLVQAQHARGDAERERDLVQRVTANAPLAIGVMDGPDHVFSLVNPATARLAGLPVDAFLGRPHREVLPEAHAAVGAVLDRVLETGQPEVAPELEVTYPNGRRANLHVTWTPLPGPDGTPNAVLYMALDMTELRVTQDALSGSEARFRAIVDELTVGIAQVDTTGRFVLVNQRLCEILCRSDEELLQMRMQDVTHPDDLPRNLELFKRLLNEGRSFVIEKRYVRPDGTSVWVSNSVSRVLDADGSVEYVVAVVEDIAERKQAEEALRSSEARFRTFFNAAAIGIALVDVEGRVFESNPALQRMLQYSAEELRGVYAGDFTHPDDLEADVALFQEVLERKRDSYQIEKRYVRKDGEVLWGRLSVGVVRDETGRPLFGVGMVEDVTERRQAQEALRAGHETFRYLVENSPFGVYAVDADFRLVQVSAGAQRVFANVRPLLGRDFAEVIRSIWTEPFASEAISRFRHTLDTGEPYHSPSTVERRRDIGEVEAYDWKIERVTLPDGRFGAVCHFYDLSERQQYEEALREADRRKDEFLAMLAHELRNPLGAVRNAVALLEHAEPGSVPFQRGLEVTKRQVRHQSQIVDDLLDLSRIRRGKMELRQESLDLAAVVRETAEDFAREVERRGLALSLDVPGRPIPVRGDRTRLAQILGNLLHNATKFTPPGGTVEVELTTGTTVAASRQAHETPAISEAPPKGRTPQDQVAVIRVRDTGIGIEGEMLSRLFEPFAQADRSLDRAPGGLGLGLALVKGLVEMHGGEVWGESAGEGKGAEFTFYVPLDREPSENTTGTRMSPSGSRPLRVLVIEDLPDAADTLRDLLELWGYSVEVAYSGPDGLDRAARFRPQVILCDIGLPGMDGYAVARKLRQQPGGAALRMVALTGYGQEEDIQRSREAGFDIHLTKPVDPERLGQCLESEARVLGVSVGTAHNGDD